MNETTDIVKKFFGVVAREGTYLNIIYLLLAFPLGTAYFIFLVTGLSLGLSLPFWVGMNSDPALDACSMVGIDSVRTSTRNLAAACRHPPNITRYRIRTERMDSAQSSPVQPFDLERPSIPFCQIPALISTRSLKCTSSPGRSTPSMKQ